MVLAFAGDSTMTRFLVMSLKNKAADVRGSRKQRG